jgi:hypothetical protein
MKSKFTPNEILISKAPDMYEMLKKIEWYEGGLYEGSEHEKDKECPFCFATKARGHFKDCKLANLLKEVEYV